MRRLPIFFLVDVSESMAGENLYKLEEGMSAIAASLRQDPYALETAYISVVIFAGKTRTIMPLTEIIAFHPPELPVAGGTAFGNALNHLMDEIDRNIISTTPDRKGDWKPIIFLLTDGHPTDDTAAALRRWNAGYRSKANLVAVSIGGAADHKLLKQLTDDVVVFNDDAPDAFGRFVKWISMSIQSQSRSVQAGNDGRVNLAKREPGLLENIEKVTSISPFSGVDDRFAVFVGKCEKSKLPYIVKYELHRGKIETADPTLAELFPDPSVCFEVCRACQKQLFRIIRSNSVGTICELGRSNRATALPTLHCAIRYGRLRLWANSLH